MRKLYKSLIFILLLSTLNTYSQSDTKFKYKNETLYGVSIGFSDYNTGKKEGNFSNILFDFVMKKEDIGYRLNMNINTNNGTIGDNKSNLSWDSDIDKINSNGSYESSINLGIGKIIDGFFVYGYAGIAFETHYRNILTDGNKYFLLKQGETKFNFSTEIGYEWKNFFFSLGGRIDFDEIGFKIGYFF